MHSRLSEFKRLFQLPMADAQAFFIWGPRQVGKSWWINRQFGGAKLYDLLKTELRAQLALNPAKLREEVLAASWPLVVVDEVQKVPALLDEIHWCLENTTTQFILCGSSARKLRTGSAGLMGGRALRREFFPLTTAEIGIEVGNPKSQLIKLLNHGTLPKHYLHARPDELIRSYILDYLETEIHQEALVRNLSAFSRFMETVALTHGQLINYANIARECGVSAKTVREYYQILEDTLLGHRLPPWQKTCKRRLIETEKFYLFDPGVVRGLKGLPWLVPGLTEFGQAFEHFLIEEIRAYLAYRQKYDTLTFWRTSTGLEVDLIVGNGKAAIEFKTTKEIRNHDLNGLRAASEEISFGRKIVVTVEGTPRKLSDDILILSWSDFCQKLWADEVV